MAFFITWDKSLEEISLSLKLEVENALSRYLVFSYYNLSIRRNVRVKHLSLSSGGGMKVRYEISYFGTFHDNEVTFGSLDKHPVITC